MYDTTRHHAGRTRVRTARPARLTPVEAAILAVLALALCLAATAGTRTETAVSFDTLSIRVAPAQTLWDLASAYPLPGLTTAETVEAIKDLNGLETSSLPAGEVVRVPAGAPEQAALAAR